MDNGANENNPEAENISTATSSPPVQTGETPPEGTEKPRNRRLQTFIEKHPGIAWLLTALVAGIIFLLMIVLFRCDVWNFIRSQWGICLTAVSSLIGLPLLKALVDHYVLGKDEKLRLHSRAASQDTREETEKMAGKGEPWLVTAATFIQSVLMWGADNKLVRTVIVVAVIVTFPSFAAHSLYEGWDLQLHFDGLGHLFEEDAEEQAPPEATSDGGSISGGGASEPAPPTPPETEPPEDDPEPAPFLLEPDRYYVLTDEEASNLFFLSNSYVITDWLSPAMVGENDPPAPSVSYEITDWNSPGEVAEAIRPFIEDLCSQQVPNMFDKRAPGTTCNDISSVSSLQEEMINSADLDRIIAVRSEVWQDYPKFGIADLLANNMQRYAQEYLEIDGPYETVKYYQAQSIFWSLKSLVFSTADPSMRKTVLNYISMRYHDIADMAVNGSLEQVRATALSEAFQILENMEFSSERTSEPEQGLEPVVPDGDSSLPF